MRYHRGAGIDHAPGVHKLRARDRIEKNCRQRTQRRFRYSQSAGFRHQDAGCLHQSCYFIGPAHNSQRHRCIHLQAFKPAQRVFVLSSHSHDMHWFVAFAQSFDYLIHSRRPHASAHQQHHRKVVANSIMEPRYLWIVQNIERRIERDSANRNAIRRRAPGDHLGTHKLVSNSEAVNLRLHPDRFRLVVGDHAQERRLC